MSYSEAMKIWHDHSAPDDGFYLGNQDKGGKRNVILATMLQGKKNKEKLLDRVYNVYKPNTGLQSKPESLTEIKKRYKKVRQTLCVLNWSKIKKLKKAHSN